MESAEKNPELVERLKAHVYKLSAEIGDRSIFEYAQLTAAADYITQEFKAAGYRVEFQEYSVKGVKVKNIIATKKGETRPEEVIIVGAHYDTCFNPGADDNASAVAGLLEIAKFISPRETSRTIKFITFVNEEPPFFKSEKMGSWIYARAAKKRKENIQGAVILESLGYYSDEPNSQRYPPFLGLFYPNKANFICVVGNFTSGKLVKRVVSAFKKVSRFPIESFTGPSFVPGVTFSDHWSFWQEGFPAVMVTDTAFLRYPHYHSQADTYEKLDYPNMAEVVRGLFGAILKLGGE